MRYRKLFTSAIASFLIATFAFSGLMAQENEPVKKEAAKKITEKKKEPNLHIARLSDQEVTVRIDYIQKALDEDQLHAQIWWYGWISLYGAMTIVQGGLYFNDSFGDHTKQDMLVGAATSLLGLIGKVIDPFYPAYYPDRLRVMPRDTPEERKLKLESAEAMLLACSKRERSGWSWMNHALNFAVNAAAGLVTTFAFKRSWKDGLLTFALGMAISEVDIFSQPTRAMRNMKSYSKKFGSGHALDTGTRKWFFSIYPGGVVVGTHF